MKLALILSLIFVVNQAFAQLAPMSLFEARTLLDDPLPEPIKMTLQNTPSEYSFFNSSDENSVVYSGQVMRNVLISDSKAAFSSLDYGSMNGKAKKARTRLQSFYLFNYEDKKAEPILVTIKDENGEAQRPYEFVYGSLYGKAINLKSKMAGVDNDLRHGQLLGWNSDKISGIKVDRNDDGIKTPGEFYEAMVEVVVKNASGSEKSILVRNPGHNMQEILEAEVTVEGLDLAQLSQKFLHGAISFSQAAGDYTAVDLNSGKGLLANNSQLEPGLPYTSLQHHWDEAFGYFGAARNYLDYSTQQVRDGVSLDVYRTKRKFSDEKVLLYHEQSYGVADKRYSLGSEKNLGLSVNAAKRALGAEMQNENFGPRVVSAFLKGRQLVQEAPEGYLPYAQAHGVVAIHEWERVIAATVIHYVNKTIVDLNQYGTKDFNFKNLAKHYSEMKGFALAFQFNPNSVLLENGTASFVKLHSLMGDRPVSLEGDISGYISNLEEVNLMLAQAYEFDQQNVENW